MDRRPLFVFSPLPPAKNGIVDYMYALLQELQTNYYDCSVFCADVFPEAPHHVRVRDEALALRHLHGADRILHQIGNNPDHISVVQGLPGSGADDASTQLRVARFDLRALPAVLPLPIGRQRPSLSNTGT
jgi:hypothetical protein